MPAREFSALQTALTPRITEFIPLSHLKGGNLGRPQHALLCLSHLIPLERPSEVLYGGSAGGGKTDALLMAALQYVDVPGYAALILRRTFKQLALPDAAMSRSHEWLRGTQARWRGGDYTWTFPSGATLTFGHLQHEESKYDYQGAAFQFVGFDELTQFTESQYEYLHSRTRRLEGALVPIRVWSTSNPGGVGHQWVRSRFIDGPATYVPARLWDNPNIDQAAYARSLGHLPDSLRRQLLEGDWDAFEGMAFPDWSPLLHVVEPFEPPPEWERFESFDHGTSNPSALLVWAADHDGNLVVFDSYYSPGLPSEHAAAWKAKRALWWPRDERGELLGSPVTYADPEMWATKGEHPLRLGEPASDVTEYVELGIEGLARANNRRSPGRVRVAELLRPVEGRPFPVWHRAYGRRDAPRLYVVGRRCGELCEQLASAPLLALDSGQKGAGEIIDPAWEGQYGHAVAALRYGAMSRPEASERPARWEPDPRVRMALRISEAEREADELARDYGWEAAG